MTRGRVDYWYGILPGKTVLGPYQEPWFEWLKERIAANDAEDFNLYTVPAKYRLYLTGGSISCQSPGINRFLIFNNDDIVLDMAYDQMQILPITEGGPYIFEAGDVVRIRIYNYDLVYGDFHLTLSGFREYLKL